MTVPMDSASAAPSSTRDLAERLLTRVKAISSSCSLGCYTANTTGRHYGFLIHSFRYAPGLFTFFWMPGAACFMLIVGYCGFWSSWDSLYVFT
jgi:hypothetical protein